MFIWDKFNTSDDFWSGKFICSEGDDANPAGGNPPANTPPGGNSNPAPAKNDPDVIAAERAERQRIQAQLDKEKADREAAEKKLEEIERKRLEEEGNWKALAERESNRVAEVEKEKNQKLREYEQKMLTTELRARLVQEGIVDLDYSVLVDRSKITIEDGEIKGLEEAVKDLKDRKPAIFKGGSTTANVNNPPPADRGGDKHVKDVTKMTPEEYRDYRKQTLRNIRGGRF